MNAIEEEEIVKLMCVFPAYYEYKSNPTFEQMEELVKESAKLGYLMLNSCICSGTVGQKKDVKCDNLYHIFASGNIPDDLDVLIKRLAQHWKPSGEIVDSGSVVRQIGGKKE